MNRISSLLVAIGIAIMLIGASVPGLTNAAVPLELGDLVGALFESVSVDDSSILLKFKTSGRRFKYTISEDLPKISTYVEIVRIPVGSRFRLVDKETELVLSALPPAIKNCGFLVRLSENHCSVGKTREVKEGYLIFQERVKDWRSIPHEARVGGVIITEASMEAISLLGITGGSDDGANGQKPDLKK